MKRLLIMFVITLFVTNLLADDVKLVKAYDEKTYDDRIGTVIPTVNQENNVLTLYSIYPIEDIQVTVTDAVGKVVYAETITLWGQQPYDVVIDKTTEGVYTILLEYEKTALEGNFEIN